MEDNVKLKETKSKSGSYNVLESVSVFCGICPNVSSEALDGLISC